METTRISKSKARALFAVGRIERAKAALDSALSELHSAQADLGDGLAELGELIGRDGGEEVHTLRKLQELLTAVVAAQAPVKELGAKAQVVAARAKVEARAIR